MKRGVYEWVALAALAGSMAFGGGSGGFVVDGVPQQEIALANILNASLRTNGSASGLSGCPLGADTAGAAATVQSNLNCVVSTQDLHTALIASHGATIAAHMDSINLLADRTTAAERNIVLNWVNQQAQDSMTRFKLVDGYNDYFTDQTGIDGARSSNLVWSVGSYAWGTGPYINKIGSGTASASGVWQAGYEASKAFDNNWVGDGWFDDNPISGWLKYDFGVATNIGQIVYLNGNAENNGDYDFTSAKVEWSDNDSDWTVALDTFTPQRTIGGAYRGTNTFPASVHRYWRLYVLSIAMPAWSLAGLRELQFLAPSIAHDVVDIVATNNAATLLDFTPATGRLGLWIEERESALAPNADATAYLSRDSGTNWAQVVFDSSLRFSTNSNQYIWFSAVTNLPGEGSNLLWKFQSVNTNKNGKLRGVFPQAR